MLLVDLEKPEVQFIAGENAPDIYTAPQTLIPDHLGRFALNGFRVDAHDPTSKVELDLTSEPPRIVLHNAKTSTVYGSTRDGVFTPDGGYMPEIAHTVSGFYTGPGSTLDVK